MPKKAARLFLHIVGAVAIGGIFTIGMIYVSLTMITWLMPPWLLWVLCSACVMAFIILEDEAA